MTTPAQRQKPQRDDEEMPSESQQIVGENWLKFFFDGKTGFYNPGWLWRLQIGVRLKRSSSTETEVAKRRVEKA